MKIRSVISAVVVGVSGLLVSGCAHVDSLASHMDMAVTRTMDRQKPHFEGVLVDHEQIGAMTALHFENGKYIDVVEAPQGLLAGDIVRIYETDKGLVAHLWRRAS